MWERRKRFLRRINLVIAVFNILFLFAILLYFLRDKAPEISPSQRYNYVVIEKDVVLVDGEQVVGFLKKGLVLTKASQEDMNTTDPGNFSFHKFYIDVRSNFGEKYVKTIDDQGLYTQAEAYFLSSEFIHKILMFKKTEKGIDTFLNSIKQAISESKSGKYDRIRMVPTNRP